MVRLAYDNQGRKEYTVNQDDMDFFFGEVMGRVIRPQLPTPTAPMLQALPEPVFLPAPPQQHLLMPAAEELPAPHPALMPGYQPSTQRMAAFEPVRIKKPTVWKIAIALLIAHKRQAAIAGLSLATALFLIFAGSFLVRKVTPETSIEVGPVEAIGDPQVESVEGEEAPTEPSAEPLVEEKPVMQFPTFPAIPR